jgi:hypothetical protein
MAQKQLEQTQFTMTIASNTDDSQAIKPSTVSIPKLIETLNQIDNGARAYAPSEIAKNKELPVLALTAVTSGSVQLQFSTPPEHAMFPAAFAQDLERKNWNIMPLDAYKAAVKLHKSMSHLNANLHISSDSWGIDNISIHATDPTPKREAGLVSGSLSLAGQIIQTGGARPAIDFRLDSTGKILHGISVDTSTARLVGQRLYTPVVITGEAVWNADTWEVEEFKFISLSDSLYQSPSAALAELHQLLGNTWSDVDVDKFMLEVRGGEN